MSKLAQSSQIVFAGPSTLPPGAALDLMEILELCAQLRGEVVAGSKAAKLVAKIETVASAAAESIREDLAAAA